MKQTEKEDNVSLLTRNSSNKVKIPCFESDPIYGKHAIVGKISIRDLLPNKDVDTSRPDHADGYQRVLRQARKQEISKSVLSKRGDIQFPTSIVISVRDEKAFNHVKNGIYQYDPNMHGPLWLVDGQSRCGGLEHALDEADKLNENGSYDDIINTILNKNLTVCILFTDDVNVEMRVFVDINNNAKKVETNLAMEILQKRYQAGESDVAADLKVKGEEWRLLAGEVVEQMEKSSVWYRRIKKSGAVKLLNPNVGFASMQTYVKHVLEGNYFKGKKNARVLASEAVIAYWEGFALAWPNMFDKPNDYTVQSAMGADVFMRLFDKIVSWTQINQSQSRDNQLLSNPETYKAAFIKIIKNSIGYNRNGVEVDGHRYWVKGSEGAAGMYTSGAGKQTLTNLCCDWLESDES